MKIDNLRQDQGVAGLTILLSLVTMLFVIGLLVMIFSLMGGELGNTESAIASESATITQTAVVTATGSPTDLTTCLAKPNGVSTAITSVANDSADTVSVTVDGNFTLYNNCTFIAVAGGLYDNETLTNVTYTMTFSGSAFDVINDTTTGISNVTDWYPIFIVIGAMVVLILLTVIIITAIRGSGLMGDTSRNASGNVGSA